MVLLCVLKWMRLVSCSVCINVFSDSIVGVVVVVVVVVVVIALVLENTLVIVCHDYN